MKLLPFMIALLFIFPSFSNAEEKMIVMASNNNPFYPLIASAVSHHFKSPLLLFKNGIERQQRFIKMYDAKNFIVIGKKLNMGKNFNGSASKISIEIARQYFKNSKNAVIIPYNDYKLSLIAVPIACYMDAPLIIYQNNENEVKKACNEIGIENVIAVGNISIFKNEINLKNESMIYDYIEKLKRIDYIAITNPDDVENVAMSNQKIIERNFYISNLKIIFGYAFNIFGSNEKDVYFNVSEENELKILIEANATIYGSLYENGKLVSYSNSMAYENGKCFIQTFSNPGRYRLHLKFYNGKIGGYFIQHGISFLNTPVHVRIKMEKMQSYPYRLHISYLAPYLACHHNGMVIAANGIAWLYKKYGYPWINASVIPFVNNAVNETLEKIKKYVGNASYLAIVGDNDEIPMYYFSPSTGDAIVGYGIPSDMPYSFNYTLAVGRIVAFDDIDASLFISRDLFYYDIVKGDWLNRFVFINGEGFGEMAAIFHQIPYSKFVSTKFNVSFYGDFKNDRNSLEKHDAFNASYVEYEGHGDWFWMFANIYSNYYNNIDAAFLKNYEIKPAVILTAACLMARIDGIVLNESVALSFIHAGAVAFIGATRETGSEAKLDWIENDLLQNDTTIGMAFIHSKMMEEMPTKAARVLYGDPALNPWK